MTFVQNREIPGPFPGLRDCHTDAAYAPGRPAWRTACSPGFLERHWESADRQRPPPAARGMGIMTDAAGSQARKNRGFLV